MPATVTVTLGETTHEVPKMNIGQIEDLQALDVPPSKWTFAAIVIIMRRATPKIDNMRDVEAEPQQLRAAIEQVMANSGYKVPDPNAPAPDPAMPGQNQDAS